MKKINFRELEIYTDISKKKKIIGDARQDFANLLYMASNGIVAHALAFKIYESEGEMELTDQEADIIVLLAQERCTPAVIDGINEQLNLNPNE